MLSQLLKKNFNKNRKKHIVVNYQQEMTAIRNETTKNLGTDMVITQNNLDETSHLVNTCLCGGL